MALLKLRTRSLACANTHKSEREPESGAVYCGPPGNFEYTIPLDTCHRPFRRSNCSSVPYPCLHFSNLTAGGSRNFFIAATDALCGQPLKQSSELYVWREAL